MVQRLLPERLEVQTFQGHGWVGVTPLFLEDLRTPVAPALRWFTSFPETNVRTYVVGPDGREGLWFFHYLIARWQLYTTLGRCWPGPTSSTSRGRCTVRELDSNLVAAAGLPPPEGDPVVHWSPGGRTRISGLSPLGRA